MGKTSKLLISLGCVTTFVAGCIFLSNKEPAKYSPDWIKRLTDKEWDIEREIVRKKFCNPKYNEATRVGFQKLLNLFDKVKSDRDWAGLKPHGPAYHREHGFNLYKP